MKFDRPLNSIAPCHEVVRRAVLIPRAGTVFPGSGQTPGEVSFNISITGYQKILTDECLKRTNCHFRFPENRERGRQR